MAPVAQDDTEMDSHTSGQYSPVRRNFSESTSTRASVSPAPMVHETKCNWCGKYFETIANDVVSQNEALKEHIATVHPHIAKFAMMYDGAADEESETGMSNRDDDTAGVAESRDTDEDDGVLDGIEAGEAAFEDGDKENDEVDQNDVENELANQLHEFSREGNTATVEKRLHHYWNVHDPSLFSKEYNETTAHLDRSWDTIMRDPKRAKKRGASEILERPLPYKKTKVAKGEYLDIPSVDELLAQLRDPESLTYEELYMATENAAHALKAWQDESMAIDKLHKRATRHNARPTTNPRKWERPEVYEDKKEAMLYGYKHEAHENKIGRQNPFLQGGFKPTPAQIRKIMAKAGPSNPNPDGWPTIKKFGLDYVPMLQVPPPEEPAPKATRKRKAAELEAAESRSATPATPYAGVDTSALQRKNANVSLASSLGDAERPPKRRGGRRLGGRSAGEPQQAEVATTPSRGGRGRRGKATATIPSRLASEAPRSTGPSAPKRSTARAYVRRTQPAPGPPNKALSPSPAASDDADVELDPAAEEEAARARREKIMNSKNPKRTEAMLDHWDRFKRAQRHRNPKRSKEQIEKDRVDDAAKKAAEGPKLSGRKKSSRTPVPTLPAPAPAPFQMQAQVAPGPPMLPGPLPPSSRYPIQQPGGPIQMNPFPPIDPRAVGSFPPGPYGPLHQPPPQYQTPYPDQYMGYRPAAPGVPPPGHMRPE